MPLVSNNTKNVTCVDFLIKVSKVPKKKRFGPFKMVSLTLFGSYMLCKHADFLRVLFARNWIHTVETNFATFFIQAIFSIHGNCIIV